MSPISSDPALHALASFVAVPVAAQTTTLLWDTYGPYRVWFPFAGIGIASAIAIFFYAIWVRRHEAPDI